MFNAGKFIPEVDVRRKIKCRTSDVQPHTVQSGKHTLWHATTRVTQNKQNVVIEKISNFETNL